jgi:hypothetical protein
MNYVSMRLTAFGGIHTHKLDLTSRLGSFEGIPGHQILNSEKAVFPRKLRKREETVYKVVERRIGGRFAWG